MRIHQTIAASTIILATMGLSGANAAELISDGNFLTPALPTNGYIYPGYSGAYYSNYATSPVPATYGSWTFQGTVGNTGISASTAGAALANGPNPSGAGGQWYNGYPEPANAPSAQFAALQGTASLSQSFTTAGGTLDLMWESAGRPGNGTNAGDQNYDVVISSDPVSTYGPYSTTDTITPTFGPGSAFTTYSQTITGLAAGTYTLTFQGLDTLTGGDQTSFIDNVSLTAVPEPATWAMLLLGFFGIGFMARGSRRKDAAALA